MTNNRQKDESAHYGKRNQKKAKRKGKKEKKMDVAGENYQHFLALAK